MRAHSGRAALARLLGSGWSPEAVDALAPSFGFQPPDRAPPELAPPPGDPAAEVAADNPPAPAAPPPPSERPPLLFWRLVQVEYPPDEAPEEAQPAQPTPAPPPPPEDDAGSYLAGPPPAPLEPWSRLWPRLRQLVREDHVTRAVDVPALIRAISRGAPLRTLPRRTRRGWPARLEVWLDRSPRLVPLFADQRRVVDALRARLGAGLVARVIGAPQALRRPKPGITVLALSDLGAFDPARADPDRAAAEPWARAARRLLRAGARPVALVPGPPSSSATPRPATPSPWTTLPWRARSRPTTAAQVEALLDHLAPAELIQPGLLRALRRHLALGVAAELRAWNHPDVALHSLAGMTLRLEAMAQRRARAAQLPDETQAAIARLIDRWRPGTPAHLRHLETLAWRGHGGWGAGPGDLDQARAWAQSLVARARGADPGPWEAFGQAAFQRVPPHVLHDPVAGAALRQLWALSHRHLPAVRLPEGLTAEDLQPPDAPLPPLSHVQLDQRGAALALSPAPAGWAVPPTGSPLARLAWRCRDLTITHAGRSTLLRPEQGPIDLHVRPSQALKLKTDRVTVTLEPWTRPPWAHSAGRDRYGLWACLQLGPVAHRLRWIPPGRFTMGSPEHEVGRFDYEGPQREVTLSRGFWLGETPVTQALWTAVMDDNPSEFKDPERPVEQVSWDDTQRFFDRLRDDHGFTAALPTEAQWEYACRAGTQTATWLGDLEILGANHAPLLDAIAWYGGNSGHEYDLAKGVDSSGWEDKQYPHTQAGTRKVGQKQPNPFGLHDMLGNVWEWCADYWQGDYQGEPTEDPTGPARGEGRVIRGGSWDRTARYTRSASRYGYPPGWLYQYQGFRLARGQPAPGAEPQAGRSPVVPGGGAPAPAEPAAERSEAPPSPRSGDRGIFARRRPSGGDTPEE